MRPGTIVWADLDPTVGHEQRGHRPGLVISESMRRIVVVVPLTSSPPKAPMHHPMNAGDRMATALCEQVRAIDMRRITGTLGSAHPADLATVRTYVARLIGMSV